MSFVHLVNDYYVGSGLEEPAFVRHSLGHFSGIADGSAWADWLCNQGVECTAGFYGLVSQVIIPIASGPVSRASRKESLMCYINFSGTTPIIKVISAPRRKCGIAVLLGRKIKVTMNNK